MRILAVDPGKASGIAVFQFRPHLDEEPKLLRSSERQMKKYADPIRFEVALAREDDVELVIVCERFIINAATAKNTQAPYSLEQIGILKQIMLDYGIDPDTLIFQSPADAKGLFPNPALKKLEYWHKGGEGHANDAIRHALLRAVKLGWKPKRLLD